MNFQIANIIAENKILHADKMNFFYVIQETVKLLKKKHDPKLNHAINMLNSEEDQKQVRKIFQEFKVGVK